jgi:hypothetical protein
MGVATPTQVPALARREWEHLRDTRFQASQEEHRVRTSTLPDSVTILRFAHCICVLPAS